MHGTVGTVSENKDEDTNECVGTGGTVGTVLDNASVENGGISDAQVASDIESKEDVNGSDTHSLTP
jgi:hypothetical protein